MKPNTITFEILRHAVYQRRGYPDVIDLCVSLPPNPVWPFDRVCKEIRFNVPEGTGPDYIRNECGISNVTIASFPL